ncbi:unnamed protein product [Durusdinium trenchii]|uniref:Disease resistance R13L4/SHOC-2-like LRR domain-containing protein n=2 Tax=Durusdinium trenchii TaxID=1381693 RepID=A0ABP0JUH3_9DINO
MESLHLQANRLTGLPASLGNLSRLKLLQLQNNRLASLPESLGRLSSLVELYLEDNELSSLPESLGNLGTLRTLKLYNNKLKLLPPSLGSLSRLRELYLGNNKLRSLPESFVQLSALMRLHIRSNLLSSLPESLGNLSMLREIYLENNELSSLPESLGELSSLMELHLQNNRLISLPESLCNLTRLKTLYLQNNTLISLPESLGQLASLELLYLNDNFLSSLPKSAGKLSRLVELLSENNKLMQLPASLGSLSRLKILSLENNELSSLPESLGNLSGLVFLSLGKRLSSLPESFGKLSSLVWLYVQNNQLISLPESLGNLTSLTLLRLQNNQLSSLPNSFCSLRSVTKLELQNNTLSSLPECFANLAKLGMLDLQNNNLRSVPESLGRLENLRELYLQNNTLTSLPESLGGLANLTDFSAESNELSQLPESLGNLSTLRMLYLQNNHLRSLPESMGNLQNLEELYVESNSLTLLPQSLGNLPRLVRLYAQHNQLKSFWTLRMDVQLEVLLLQHNQIEMDLSFACNLKHIVALYLHDNKLKDKLPRCMGSLLSLRVLTLHRNDLTDQIPSEIARLPMLQLLTLHRNRLTGDIPENFSAFAKLSFFSAFANDLNGSIPPMRLEAGCVDDISFSLEGRWKDGNPAAITCRFFSEYGLKLDDFELTPDKTQMILNGCPASLDWCHSSSSRGPALLLQSNRLSCLLPPHITATSDLDLRSLIIIGNMLGDDWEDLPSWVSDWDRQPFLYISPLRVFGIKVPVSRLQTLILTFLALVSLFFASLQSIKNWTVHLRQIGLSHEDRTRLAHAYLLRMTCYFAPLAVFLILVYQWNAGYYTCGRQVAKTSLAHFQHESSGLGLACIWSTWVFVCAYCLRSVPKPEKQFNTRARSSAKQTVRDMIWKSSWWLLWFFVVVLLSSPSLGYAFAQTLPKQNSLIENSFVLGMLHHGAALTMLLIDMLITPKLALLFSKLSGSIRRSMLLMAARTATSWLNATLCTIYMSEHCMSGWTTFWTMCEQNSELYNRFKINLGSHELLDPVKDLCDKQDDWWQKDACVRSVVETLGPLFLSKMIQRAFLQPVLTLLQWKLSKQVNGELHFSPLAFLGLHWEICTSKSLDRAQQATFLVTLAEVVLLWSPFVPLLLPAVSMAVMTNLLMFQIGASEFHANVPILEQGETASMSRKYMQLSVGILLLFQMWFAFTSQMRGTSLLVVTALIFLGEAAGLTQHFRSRSSPELVREEGIEMIERDWR